MSELDMRALSQVAGARPRERASRNDRLVSVRALLDAPDPRAMRLLPIVVSLGTELRATGLVGGAKPITDWELETLLANGHARAIEHPLPAEAVGPLCAAWLGSAFARACEDADAPALPFDQRVMTRVPRLGWYLIDTPAAVFAALDGWFRSTFVAAIERRNREIAELLSWVDPSREETRAALYLTGTEPQRDRELGWWARLERDAGRGELDKSALLGRIDAACSRVFLDWHPPITTSTFPGRWTSVAIAARCAERLAPSIDPFPRDPVKSAVAMAIRISRDAAVRGQPANPREIESTRRALLEQVHRPWQAARISPHVLPDALRAVESALLGAEGAANDTHLDQALLSMRHGVVEVVYPDITAQPIPALWAHFSARGERAVHDDAQWLSRWSSSDVVTAAFFERDLWPEGPPVAWEDHIEQFRSRLFPPDPRSVVER